MTTSAAPVYSFRFWMLCLSSFLFSASFNMIIPELPNYLTHLGGADYKGYIIGLFTLTAGLSRPFSGKLTDTVGRLPVMYFGVAVCILCSLLYPLITTVFAFLLLRLVHGFSTGFTPTGESAYIADIVPLEQRGAAIGIFGLAGSLGLAAGPAIGGEFSRYFSLNALFYCSSGMALLSILVLVNLKETLAQPQRFRLGLLRIRRDEIFEPKVMPPFLVMLLTLFCYGAVLTVTPDFSQHLGIANKGLFFTFYTVASIGVRFLAGRASDRYGRVAMLRFSTFTMAASMLLLGLAETKTLFLGAAVLYGIGTGMNSPTLYAWAIDLSHADRRGRAMATVYIALEAGIGIGAFAAGWIYGNDFSSIPYVFWGASLLCLVAFLYVLLGRFPKRAEA
ncbi:MFS transporter [Rufibacter immobilis]|uniref:MFS transporter n=1 Tax=Rufibacter immobilis TaxID=1348778 RepID=A0A3M9MW81_9BACT|nr:MFS transporter [Rufibacter immobilis]RNI29786.1 MFS transporter [Rufibacter immobilis]